MVDVGASFPHRVTLHPTCHSLRLLAIGDRPRAVAARGARDRPGRAGGRARVLRVRRDVRDQERGHVDGDALRQGPACAGYARGGVHVRRHVVSDAHRRRAVARPHGCGPCTSRRSWRRRNAAFRAPPKFSLADSQLRRNIGKATTLIREKRLRAVGRAARLGGAARRRRGDQGAHDGDAARAAGAVGGGGRRGRRRVHWARDGAEANAIVASIAGARHRRGHQGQVAGDGRDRDERGAAKPRASTRWRPTWRS